jgi:hypothetical protein
VYFAKGWKTFPDFLIHFIGNLLGQEWGNAELRKPEAEMHPVALWYRKLALVQKHHVGKPGEVYGAPETGASRAYLDLAYNLYSLDHDAGLRAVLIERLKHPDQFLGALSEIRVAGMLVRAGFSVRFEDEADGSTTHCEYDACRLSTGKSLTIEVKTRHWDQFPANDDEGRRLVNVHVGRHLRDALSKVAAHDRVVFIELAMPDQSPSETKPTEPWWMQPAMDGVRDTERLLREQRKTVPPARVIVCNHPHHFHLDSTRSIVAYALDGIGPTDFRSGQGGSIREALRFREKHGDFLAFWNSVQRHRAIPQTFDGKSQHLAFGDHPPPVVVGNRYEVPDASGNIMVGTLEDAVVLPTEKSIYGIYRTENGERAVCKQPMSEAEAKAYAENPDTFFGVVKSVTKISDPLELYDRFLATYGTSSRDDLLRFLAERPDIESLQSLSQKELAETYCEGLVYATMNLAERNKAS